MKNLGKVIIFSLLAIVGSQAYGQKIGVQGGVNLAKMVDKDDEMTYSDEYEMNLGFNVGATVELELSKLLSVEAGALVESKGFKITEGDNSLKINLLYADIPVLVKAGYSLSSVRIFAAAGPYVGFGITGKAKEEYEGEKETTDVKWGSGDEDDLKRIDFGAKFGIGAEVMKFSLGAYYALGLANISTYTEDGAKVQNRVISISLGYRF